MMHYKIINKRKLFWIRSADSFIHILQMLTFRKRKEQPILLEERDRIKKILLIRLAYIGDVILTIPVIRPISQAFPNAELHFLTSSSASCLLKGIPELHKIIPWDAPWFYSRSSYRSIPGIIRSIRNEKYDLGIDFRGDLRNIFYCLFLPGIDRRISYSSGGGGDLLTHPTEWDTLKHKVDYHLDLLRKNGIKADFTAPEIQLMSSEIESMKQRMHHEFKILNPPIAIHPGARLPLKCWSIDHFASLIDMCAEKKIGPIVLIGGDDEKRKSFVLADKSGVHADLTGQLTLRETAAFLSQCKCLICHDSAPMHLAAAIGTRVISLFGPSRPVETAPVGKGHQIHEAVCSEKDDCDEHCCRMQLPQTCINSIQPGDVLRSIIKVLEMG